jgi:hypothetical protein
MSDSHFLERQSTAFSCASQLAWPFCTRSALYVGMKSMSLECPQFKASEINLIKVMVQLLLEGICRSVSSRSETQQHGNALLGQVYALNRNL